MLIAKPVRPEWRDRIPGIVHVDGTARVQTVREATNPRLYRLLKEFDRLTGVPVLINTSFNVKGEPIVETPQDAVICFLTTGIDHLVLQDTLVSKNAMHRLVAPIVKVFADVGAVVARVLCTRCQWCAMSIRRATHTRSWSRMWSMKRSSAAARPGRPIRRQCRPIDIIFGACTPSR